MRDETPDAIESTDEAGSLARELAHAYKEMVAFYQREYKLSAADADAKARGVTDPSPEWDHAEALEQPPDELSWYTLQRLAEREPETVAVAWTRIKAEARNELASGHRTAAALEWRGSPWDRARFLAVRDAFRADWQPCGGIEAALVDLLAQSFTAYLEWTARLTIQAASEGQVEDAQLKRDGYWQPPRLGIAAAIAQSAAMADQAHKTFLRTLRAVQDLRRLPGISVTSAGQVNIGGQQVNIAAGAADATAEDSG
jgi:hypothetical protein